MYTELFRLCGYEDAEIEKERPRIDKAFGMLGIEKEDIPRAEKRVRENFDLNLQGVRQLLHVWMDELIALPLCREEYNKVIYSDWPLPGPLVMAAHRMSDDIYIGSIGEVLNLGMGQIFDKLTPLLEAGEETGLGVGKAHCGLWQTHIGGIAKGMIPIPDLMISPNWYCDQPSHADQLLAELYDIPTVYMDGVLDDQWGQWPDISEHLIAYMGDQMEKAFKKIEEVTGYTLTEEARQDGLNDTWSTYLNFNTLAEMVSKSDPQAISHADLTLAFMFSFTPLRKRELANEALSILIRETKERIEKGEGVVEKGAPRIYFGLRFAVDPTIHKMVESLGLRSQVVFIDWMTPVETKPPKSTKYSDIVMEAFLRRGVVHSASGGIEYIITYCREWNVEGAILCFPYSCRPYAILPLMARKAIKEELGIPVLVLEGDTYDTRDYSAGQLRTRVETFAELLKMRKAA